MRYHFAQIGGSLHIRPVRDLVDLSSVRWAAQIAAGVAAPFVLWQLTEGLFAQPGAGLIIGSAAGMMLIARTIEEARQADSEHAVKIEHARELSRIEIREREARLPKRRAALPTPRGATLQPVPDPEEQEHVLMAADVRYVFEAGVRRGSFARRDFIKPNTPRMPLPSGAELTRPRFEQIIAALMADGLLTKGTDGSPRLPGGQVGGQPGQTERPQVIGDGARRVGDT